MFKKIVSASILWFCIIPSAQAGVWNGTGTITSMYIYPTYALVVQGGSASVSAGCGTTSWSFYWADYTPEAQARIMSMLLAARTANKSFQVAVSDSECGPEGKKKFEGQFQF